MGELIDTTEMYLRTAYELSKEGVPPLRARIAERLYRSGPAISRTVAWMERDSPLMVKADRTIKLTPRGAQLARDVMRKHRLVERLLTDVIGPEWEKTHAEAYHWGHVVSDEVGCRLPGVLKSPTRPPYGNPIPELRDLEPDHDHVPFRGGVVPLSGVVPNQDEVTATIEWMSENPQVDAGVLSALAVLGLRLGVEFVVRRVGINLRFCLGDGAVAVDEAVTGLLFVVSH